MKTCSKCKIEKEEINFSKQSRNRGLKTSCKDCDKVALKVYCIKNNAKLRSNRKEYYIENKVHIKEKTHSYRDKTKVERSSKNKIWYQENKQEVKYITNKYRKNNKEKISILNKGWRKQNRDKCNASYAKYRAIKLQATPKWLTEDHFKEIQLFYTKSIKLTKDTGIQYHVDHIIPLQSKMVCGLHVPWNLSVITKEQNLKKGNKYEQ